ncbi:MAG: YdcF family protein [Gammaproteobacteria bacterium]|nr:MAG: YdcF family protein [Gammaproteobacteria bacterium]
MLTKIIEWALLPPGITCILVLLGLIFSLSWRRLGHTLIGIGLAFLYIGSIPFTTAVLAKIIEPAEVLTVDIAKQLDAQAIIVIGGKRNLTANEYGSVNQKENLLINTASVNNKTLNRLRYTAKLVQAINSKETNNQIEIVLSGGQTHPKGPSRAQLMADVLRNDFNIQQQPLLEGRSLTMYESAMFTLDLFTDKEVQKVILVGDAWELPRATDAFRNTFKNSGNEKLEIIPAPVGFKDSKHLGIELWLPQGKAIDENNKAFGEIISRVIYSYFYL